MLKIIKKYIKLRNQPLNIVELITKLIDEKFFEEISSKIKCRADLIDIAGEYYKGGVDELCRKIAKYYKISFIEFIEIASLASVLKDLPIKQLKELGAFPVVNRNSIASIVAVEPNLVRERFNIPDNFPVNISTHSRIKNAWKQLEEAGKAKRQAELYSNSQVRIMIPMFLRKLFALVKNSQSEIKIQLSDEDSLYEINYENKRLKGSIDFKLSKSILEYLKRNKIEKDYYLLDTNKTEEIIFRVIEDEEAFIIFKNEHTEILDATNNNEKLTKINNLTTKAKRQESLEYKYKIVLIDDSPVFLSVLKRYLDKYNYELIGIGNPEKALEQILNSTEKPDLIISDLHMPGIQGVDILKNIRCNDSTKNLPVVMITSDTSIDTRLDLIAKGADAFIGKSEDPRLISVQVKSLLQRRYEEVECLPVS